MFKLDLSSLVGKYEKKLQVWINKSLDLLKEEIDTVTPVDTRRLKNNNKIYNAQKTSKGVKWSFENDTPYAWKIEFWEWVVYNYHDENRNVFHTWDWIQWWRRKFDENEEEIKSIIKNNLKLW